MTLAALPGMLGATLDARGDARSGDLRRIRKSQGVFHELMQTPDHAIPQELLESAKCIAIIPGEKKAAYIVVGHYGRGVAMCRTRGLVHPHQNILNATQNSLCRAVNRRRGRWACRASNCRRRARFSRTRSTRQLKELTNQPRKCRSDTIIARILAEKTELSFAPSH